jgi:uncharacterized protein (TIGR02453 family)
VYDADVRGAMEALLAELSSFGEFRIFRPYNDVRFAKGRPPYKEQIAAITEGEGGCSFYVKFNHEGLGVGAGMYWMASDQLQRFRDAVDAQRTGADLEARVAEATKAGYTVGAADELKTAPRGYAKDHPRIELLRRKGLTAFASWPVAPWLHTKRAATKVLEAWKGMAPVTEWLDANVGPSTLPPPDADR